VLARQFVSQGLGSRRLAIASEAVICLMCLTAALVNTKRQIETPFPLTARLTTERGSVRVSEHFAQQYQAAIQFMKEKLLPLATVVTPNIDEASSLTALPVTNVEQMRTAAAKLHSMGAAAVVITGGHLEKAIDLLSFTTKRGIEQEIFKSERQRSTSTHGTGCAFATAVTCHLAQGRGLPEAVLLAKAYVSAAIVHAHPMGRGIGPVHHLYRMHQQRRTIIADPEPVN